MKTCSKCKIEKEDCNFLKEERRCKDCKKDYSKKYYQENKEEISKKQKEYREENKEELNNKNKIYYQENKEDRKKYKKEYRKNHKKETKINSKKYREENKEEIKQYRKENKEIINKQKRKYKKERRERDPAYKLREDISRLIFYQLKNSGSSKNGASINQYLPYTIQQLQAHLEAQFSLPENLDLNGKVWMTSENRGAYKIKDWDENDPSTWKWQLDHKEPQSDFKITSMDSQEFRDCWALSNLRPYSARQNSIDGATRIRHKKDNQ